jgi:hypothetical protein
MKITNVPTNRLCLIIAGLVQQGLTFEAFEDGEDMWTIILTGGY